MAKVLRIKNEHGDWVSIPCLTGDSAYAIAQKNGFDGTEEEWLESLKTRFKVSEVEGGYLVEITDSQATSIFTLFHGKDGKTITKVSELENDEGYLKSQGNAAFIGYGADGEVSIGASAGVNIGSGGSVTIDGNNAAVIRSYSDVAATFNGQRISNIAKPVSDDDAVTLRFLLDMGYIQRGANDSIFLSALETKIGGGSFVVDPLAYGMTVSGNRIQDVGTPTADGDATPKKYVDEAVKKAGSATNVPTKLSELDNDVGYLKSEEQYGYIGFTNYGKRAFFEAQDDIAIVSESVHIFTDGKTVLKSNGDGGVALYVSNQRISNLANPIDDTDGANKRYVDDLIGDVETALDNIIALQNAKIEG